MRLFPCTKNISSRRNCSFARRFLTSVLLFGLFYLFAAEIFSGIALNRPVLTPDCTIVAACQLSHGGLDVFAQALRSWFQVSGVEEIVIVDWSSAVDLRSTVAEFRDISSIKTTVLRVETNMSWRLTIAYNQGFKLVTTQQVLKVDCDTTLGTDAYTQNSLGNLVLRYASWEMAHDENDIHLNGVFLARVEELKSVGGFDERFALYGWDDTDLYDRIDAYSRKRRPGSNVTSVGHMRRKLDQARLIHHLPHDRTMNKSLERFGICFNRVLSKSLQLENWTPQAASECRVELADAIMNSQFNALKCRIYNPPLPFHIKAREDIGACLEMLTSCARQMKLDIAPIFLCDEHHNGTLASDAGSISINDASDPNSKTLPSKVIKEEVSGE